MIHISSTHNNDNRRTCFPSYILTGVRGKGILAVTIIEVRPYFYSALQSIIKSSNKTF